MARIVFFQKFHIQEIEQIAKELLEIANGIPMWCFYGDLGSGKTSLISALVSKLIHVDPKIVSSPTFVYLHEYQKICHFDLYRIQSVEEFEKMGFEDYFSRICFIEWAQRILPILPERRVEIFLNIIDQNHRKIEMRIHESKEAKIS